MLDLDDGILTDFYDTWKQNEWINTNKLQCSVSFWDIIITTEYNQHI